LNYFNAGIKLIYDNERKKNNIPFLLNFYAENVNQFKPDLNFGYQKPFSILVNKVFKRQKHN